MMDEEKLMRGDQTSFYSLMRKRCINQKEFSDVSFTVGSQKQNIAAHKCVLAGRSEVFRSMFVQQTIHATGPIDIPYHLPDIRPEVFLTTMDYMYTNCCTLTPNLAPDVLAMAVDYGLDGLRKLCVRYMLDAINIESVCSILQSAVVHAQEEVLQRALTFIESHTKEILVTTQFLQLSEQALGVILRSDNLDADEMDILIAVRRWAGANQVVTGRPMGVLAAPVVRLLRLSLLSAEELSKIEEENREEQIIPVQQMAEAWRFHALKERMSPGSKVKARKGTEPREFHKFLSK